MTLDRGTVTPLVKVVSRIGKNFSSDALAWDYTMFDTHNMWDPADPKKVWIPIDGIYEVIFTANQGGTVVSFDPFISRNFIGTPPVVTTGNMVSYLYVPRMNSAAWSNLFGCAVHPLKAGDYIALSSQRSTMATSNSGSAVQNALSFLTVRWLDRL